MLIVTISEKGEPATSTNFDKSEVTIGRVKGNDIVLPKTNVSKRHARIVLKDGKTILIDLKSTNGTYVNGRKISNPQVLSESDKVFIGDFTLEVKDTHTGEEARPAAAHIPLPSFGAAGPSAVSLPSVGSMDAGAELMGPGSRDGQSGMSAPHGGSVPSYHAGLPGIGSTPSGASFPAAGLGPKPSLSGPPSLGGPSASVPNLSPASHAGAPNLSGPSAMGPGHAGPGAAPSLGQGVPSIGPGAPSLGAANAPSASSSNLSAAPRPAEAAQAPAAISPLSAPASMGPVSASRPTGAGISVPAGPNEGVLDKSLRLPGSGTPEKVKGNIAQPLPQAVVSHERELVAATLPEDTFIEDVRSREGDIRLEAARVLMDAYLSEVGMDALMQQPYPPSTEIQDACYDVLSRCLEANRAKISAGVNNDDLLDFCLKEAAFLGSIEYLLDDEDITDFTVYRPDMVVVERAGRREVSDYQFSSANTLFIVAQRLLALQGLNAQTAPSFNEVRLGDGTQIQVMLPPAAVSSATICVRKLRRNFSTLNELVHGGMLSQEMEKFLLMCIKAKRNILVVGPQGSGRTSLLNALCSEIADGERIATVESGAMLMLPQVSVLSLEAQPIQFGQGSDMGSLVRQAVRMRAERIIVDSIQGGAEASAFVQAITGGVQGCIASILGLRAQDGVVHLARLLNLDGRGAGVGSLAQLVSDIHIVVCLRGYGDNKHRITEIAELDPSVVTQVCLTTLFEFVDTGMGQAGGGAGKHRGCGHVAHFYKELERGGVSLDSTIFSA